MEDKGKDVPEQGSGTAEPKLITYIISPPVRTKMEEARVKGSDVRVPVIICPSTSTLEPELGVLPARDRIFAHLKADPADNPKLSDFYVFANLLPQTIENLSKSQDVWQIWLDHKTESHLLSSVETIKAAACWRTFEARGEGITWAVLDSGISGDHPHFKTFNNLDNTLRKNFSGSPGFDDVYGHGTHVAGIIAGCAGPLKEGDAKPLMATYLEDANTPKIDSVEKPPSGVAPKAKLVNVKVLNDDGTGSTSAAILGLQYLRKINQSSPKARIDGANLSLGYPFDPKWYGCGHSPLCEEVRRTVEAGIIVVISAGNSGYGTGKGVDGTEMPVYYEVSINDPGNTEVAITVGSAHKSAPHTYGISYFSSKGPTGDGRPKPDLVAPGEKIISCSNHFNHADPNARYDYEEKSGTSMAAPHVSGAIAAFLSIHGEFRGQPGMVKDVFLKSATDLRRSVAFQGAGMVDLMRAIMSV